jgi:hypothetical protein
MNIVLMTGDHPRHAYIARCAAESGRLRGIIVESRETFVPAPPSDLRDATRALFVRHFEDRSAAEQRFFGDDPRTIDDVETLRVTQQELNGPRVWEFLERMRPELLISYGVHKLDDRTLSQAPGLRWNIHGGLSPWYRGVATHFWPSYFLEPQMTGMTVHCLTQAIDGGDTVHQVTAKLVRGDGIHDLACRAVMGLGAELAELFECGFRKKSVDPTPQGTTGRIWRNQDWRPEHLHLIYDLYRNRIVDSYLDSEFRQHEPKLIRAF